MVIVIAVTTADSLPVLMWFMTHRLTNRESVRTRSNTRYHGFENRSIWTYLTYISKPLLAVSSAK